MGAAWRGAQPLPTRTCIFSSGRPSCGAPGCSRCRRIASRGSARRWAPIRLRRTLAPEVPNYSYALAYVTGELGKALVAQGQTAEGEQLVKAGQSLHDATRDHQIEQIRLGIQ